jgi:hypothetical protein
MAKKEKEKFAQTSITLEMVEIAQEYVPDLFGKFSKTKTGSVLKKLRKEISVTSYVWNSYTSPSETPIPVLLQVFNSVINAHTKDSFNNEMDESHMDQHDDNEAEIATLRAELARVNAERDDAIYMSDSDQDVAAEGGDVTEEDISHDAEEDISRDARVAHVREKLSLLRACARELEEQISHERAVEPDGPPPPLELVMCMPDGTELPQCWWESSFATVFSDEFWEKITEPMGDEVVEETIEEILDTMYSWTKNYTVAAFKKRYKKDKIDPITLWQSICEELYGTQKHSNAIKKEKLHPIIKRLEIKMTKNGDETMLLSMLTTMTTQKINYESRVKKIPKNFKDAIQQIAGLHL